MTSKVRREDLVDYATWADDVRPGLQEQVMAAKADRRVAVEPAITFLFENALTIRWQVQEMMRVERIVKEADIAHELTTYNGLLGGPGELGVVVLIEVVDPEERALRLVEWKGLIDHLYLELEDGTKVRPTFDPMQVGDEKLSAVQYLKFDTAGAVPVAAGADHPTCTGRTPLSERTRAALREDLASD